MTDPSRDQGGAGCPVAFRSRSLSFLINKVESNIELRAVCGYWFRKSLFGHSACRWHQGHTSNPQGSKQCKVGSTHRGFSAYVLCIYNLHIILLATMSMCMYM
ncbi:hypothetical protein AG1IA_06716 [Rhizoctonia solani AG-1 IA]|uniref:Uncharacterized protein n=1 Tax=Thanatephorus cucumeris (strain AG1-IA) TaxID=983506 RepID=L8WS94_THACA|nr:hypothetical protein AG1IA_06716 [Rhizoctonia solani AG-1 IA]